MGGLQDLREVFIQQSIRNSGPDTDLQGNEFYQQPEGAWKWILC